jgi:hypothetical protein
VTERDQGASDVRTSEESTVQAPHWHGGSAVITDARPASSAEMSSRVRRYTITMAFRTACFVSMIFVGGVTRWILFACAVVLPYIAVVLANQANQRQRNSRIASTLPIDQPQLTTGHEDDVEVVNGRVVGEEGREPGDGSEHDQRVA